jgi:hypothetical protein
VEEWVRTEAEGGALSRVASPYSRPAHAAGVEAKAAVERAKAGDPTDLVALLAGAYVATVLASRVPSLTRFVDAFAVVLERGDPARPTPDPIDDDDAAA